MVGGHFCPGSWFFITTVIIIFFFSMGAQWSRNNSSCALRPLSPTGSFLSSFSLHPRSDHNRLLLNCSSLPTAFNMVGSFHRLALAHKLGQVVFCCCCYCLLFYHRQFVRSCGSRTLFKNV